MTVGVNQFLYGRTHEIRGRVSVFKIWVYNMRPWTFTCSCIDVKDDNRGRPPVSLLT